VQLKAEIKARQGAHPAPLDAAGFSAYGTA